MFKQEPKAASPLLNMQSVNHERKYPHVAIMPFVLKIVLYPVFLILLRSTLYYIYRIGIE